VDVAGADAGDVGSGDVERVGDGLVDLAVGAHPFFKCHVPGLPGVGFKPLK
jgi:hypothetical protein